MKISLKLYGHRWATPRLCPGFYFEDEHIAVWLDFGTPGVDPVVGVTLSADLSPRTAAFLDRVLP